MSAFVILFLAALLSFAIHRLPLLKLLSIVALAVSGYLALTHHATPLMGFALTSGVALFELLVFIVLGAVILGEEEGIDITQTLFIAAASVLVVESNTFLSFILSFEALSIISFVLVSNIKDSTQATGALKMFIAGAVATGLIVLGVTLYSFEGHSLGGAIDTQVKVFGTLGLWIVLMGLFYKLTIVPMHTWAADSYAQIKPSHAAILSGVVKSVAVIGTFKIFAPYLSANLSLGTPILVLLALLTMTLGNFLALFQTNIGKILSYSSIAHGGYMLLGFVAVGSSYASTGVLYGAIAYIFMQTALFLLVDRLANSSTKLTLDDLKGLATRDKLVALFLTIQLFSLAGIPLLAGFLGKAVLVYAVVDVNLTLVALITLLNSALSVAYYAWIIKHIYFDAPHTQTQITKVGRLPIIAQTILLFGTLYFGIFAYSVFAVVL